MKETIEEKNGFVMATFKTRSHKTSKTGAMCETILLNGSVQLTFYNGQ